MLPRFKPKLGFEEFFNIFKFKNNSVAKFEKNFAKEFQAVDAVAFPYGRSAQWAFLRSMGIIDSEIIMPAYTCSVVAHAISLSGNKPRFVDIDLKDFNMNLDLIEEKINSKTKGIIATHTFGYPQDIKRLECIVKNAEDKYGHKIWLLQDCCHAFGAEVNGNMIGKSGDVAIYAFNISKIINSVFGGMLTFQDQNIANKVREWRDMNFKKPGILKAVKRRLYLLSIFVAFNKFFYNITYWLQKKTSLLNVFTDAYHLDNKIHFPPDYLVQMTDFEASIGLCQLKKYKNIIELRRKMAKKYSNDFIHKSDWILPPIIEGATYSHYSVIVPNKKLVIDEYHKKGIQLGELIQYSVPELECYKHIGDICPNSIIASKRTINFPVS